MQVQERRKEESTRKATAERIRKELEEMERDNRGLKDE